MAGEVIKPGKYPPTASAISGWARPLSTPAMARNQAANRAGDRAARRPKTDADQIASQTTLKVTKAVSGMAGRPKSAGNAS